MSINYLVTGSHNPKQQLRIHALNLILMGILFVGGI